LKSRQIPRCLFQRGKKRSLLSEAFRKALLSLKKTGGIYEAPFQKTKLIPKIELLLFLYLPRGPLFAIIKTKEAAFDIVSREGFKFLSRIFGIPEGII